METLEAMGLRAQVDAEHERLDAEEAVASFDGGLEEQIPGQTTIYGDEVVVEEPDLPVEELRVDGTAQLGLFDAGGKRPTEAVIRLSGGAFTVAEGRGFRKGDRIRFEGVAVVREVAQKDKPDRQTGIVTQCVQSHRAEITDLVVFPAGQAGEES